MTINEINCDVCKGVGKAKYKCPKCRIPYCSIACYKRHKSDGCNSFLFEEDRQPREPSSSNYQYPTEDTVPSEKLQLLRQNPKIRDLLDNPHLRTIIEAVNNAPYPVGIIHEAMLEPIFAEFADECLKVLQNNDTNNDTDD
ncbi:hypothetical protein O3M35_001112 [Rhynocoris fuscipes]|uniref:HIT-type domain-containing protein n=1 Tax=Rhynocoris fuscipes TaxID=488301 RepID=A0AAW1DQL3_9HEMI